MEKYNCTLEQVPANRRLVEELYAHGKITQEARDYALNLLYPHNQWGLWISRMLLVIGAALVLSGIVYFFAFNWAKIPPSVKLSSIQGGIIACLAGAWFYSLERISGQVLLLSASVLVGVFMAVFGQVYQTGADAYQLFMMWSLLTFGWVLVSNFAAQWIVWLVITNIFLVLWWQQAALPTEAMEHMIFAYLAILNGATLALREYLVMKKVCTWLDAQWIRVVLTIATLTVMLIPIVGLVTKLGYGVTESILLSSVIGLAGHGTFYCFYRYKRPDMWALAAVALSVCITIEVAAFRVLMEMPNRPGALAFLLIGLMTLGIFTGAIIYLRKVAKEVEMSRV